MEKAPICEGPIKWFICIFKKMAGFKRNRQTIAYGKLKLNQFKPLGLNVSITLLLCNYYLHK